VAYARDWEKLANALKRVTACGVTKKEAKSDLCGAMADRKIKVRLTVSLETDIFTVHRQMVANALGLGSNPKHFARKTECFDGANVKVPSRLTALDFDWRCSRPHRPWPIRLHGARRDEWRSFSQPALCIELRTVDVINVVLGGELRGNQAKQPTTTVAQESAAIKALASELQHNRDLKREDAATWCRRRGYNLTARGFKDRVWPQARAKAGLPTKGLPGRKRKSAH
jgi:hypothetical protein